MQPQIIYSVTEITRLIKKELEPKFENIWVTGEISNLRTYSSGHMYFSLKDEFSQINAIIFNYQTLNLKFQLTDGLKVIVNGRISVYQKRGEYRIVVSQVEPVGKGELQLAFEQLKEKLAREGLFDESRKKPIPYLIQKIGIVTSPDGAAIRDILSILRKSDSNIEILFFPTKVQGDEAKYEISYAINYLNTYYPYLDVLLVGRGGGSLEDLWAFNEEITVRAIANSKIPVISCVGHEVDYTIADFVSDMRAPTPSAAAEFIVKSRINLNERINRLTTKLYHNFQRTFEIANFKLNSLSKCKIFQRPLTIIEEKTLIVSELTESLIKAFKNYIEIKTKELTLLKEKLNALSPLKILERGYSIVYKEQTNKIVKKSKELKTNEIIRIRFHEGQAIAKVKTTQ